MKDKLDIPYPSGHNWEGLTPRQVNEAYAKMDNQEEEKIEKELNELLEKISDNQFWAWVRSWFDTNDIYDTIKNWDTEVKADAIKEIKQVIINVKE